MRFRETSRRSGLADSPAVRGIPAQPFPSTREKAIFFEVFRGLAVLGMIFISGWSAWAEDVEPLLGPVVAAPRETGQALIVVGLPGDAEHETQFTDTVQQWRKWLTGPLGFQLNEVRILFGREGKEGLAQGPATREAIEKEAARLKQTLRPDDRLWVFYLGHANFDDRHAWLHLPGPDMDEETWGKLFAGISCRQQVFWLTGSESGRFIHDLSAKDRIIITATRSKREDNETEFPGALTDVVRRPLKDLDLTQDGKVSLLEVFYLVLGEVQARYESDERAPTEHALLDDNGDRSGTERPLAAAQDNTKPLPDGILSFKTILPYPPPPPPPPPETPKEPIGGEPAEK